MMATKSCAMVVLALAALVGTQVDVRAQVVPEHRATPHEAEATTHAVVPDRKQKIRIAKFFEVAGKSGPLKPVPDLWFDCLGSNGVSAVLGVSGAHSGGRLVLHARGNCPALILFGTSNQQFEGLSLPFDLSAFGAPGCQLSVSIGVALPVATSGDGTVVVPLPVDAWGTSFFAQAMVLDAAANAAGVTMSNAVAIESRG